MMEQLARYAKNFGFYFLGVMEIVLSDLQYQKDYFGSCRENGESTVKAKKLEQKIVTQEYWLRLGVCN